MKLLRRDQIHPNFHQGVVATIGNFDGIHLGHQQLLNALGIKANEKRCPLVVVLFEPQPREYFLKEASPPRLSSLREKLQFLKQAKVDWVYCIPFNHTLAHTDAENFARRYLFERLQVRYLLVGQDFRFGQDRMGDLALLKTLGLSYGAEVKTLPDLFIDGEKVSSTRVRSALQAGNLQLAKNLLGRTYHLSARVVAGDGRARQWGIPTANISLRHRALAMKGVFVVQARRASSEMLQGIANIGTRPTVDGLHPFLEVHFFDFNASLYGERLELFFLHKLRDEVKFPSVDTLIAQIHCDIAAAKQFFNPAFSE